MKVTINFKTYECKSVMFPDGYPKNRYIWLLYDYGTTEYHRDKYLNHDFQCFEITNKTYIKIE